MSWKTEVDWLSPIILIDTNADIYLSYILNILCFLLKTHFYPGNKGFYYLDLTGLTGWAKLGWVFPANF